MTTFLINNATCYLSFQRYFFKSHFCSETRNHQSVISKKILLLNNTYSLLQKNTLLIMKDYLLILIPWKPVQIDIFCLCFFFFSLGMRVRSIWVEIKIIVIAIKGSFYLQTAFFSGYSYFHIHSYLKLPHRFNNNKCPIISYTLI